MTSIHPVIQVLRARREGQGSSRERTDGFRVGLAVEGGGMRGVISGAMMTALKDRGLADCFDAVYAISAGAINSAYFIAGAGWYALSVYYDDLIGRDFFDPRRLISGRPALSLDYVLDVVLETKKPLDYQAVLSSPTELHVSASSINKIAPQTFTKFQSKEQLKVALRASACLPLIAGPPVVFNDDRFLDGGVLLAHPVLIALEDKCTHVLVIRTRAEGPVKAVASLQQRLIAQRLQHLHAGLGPALLATIKQYGELRKHIQQVSDSQQGPPFILDVGCPPGSHNVTRLSQDRGILFEGIRAGYSTMIGVLDSQYTRTYLRPALTE